MILESRLNIYQELDSRTSLEGGIVDVHGGDTSPTIVVGAKLDTHSVTDIAAQIKFMVTPGLGVLPLPEESGDPVAIPV